MGLGYGCEDLDFVELEIKDKFLRGLGAMSNGVLDWSP